MYRYVYDVARNHCRILNHIGLIKKKIAFGKQTGLIRNCSGSPSPPSGQELECGLTSKIEFKQYVENLLAYGKIDYREALERIVPIGLLEVHPTDICNLNCVKCYYSRSRDTLPIRILPRVLRLMQPKGVVLVGGGEPTLYCDRETGAGFNDLVLAVKETLPNVKVGLITNGSTIPEGDWIKYISWLRVSVDAVSAETYEQIKGKNAFNEVVGNLMAYLESEVQHVGAGFLCTRINIDEAPRFIAFMQKKLEQLPEIAKNKLNIQFRPFRKRPDFTRTVGVNSKNHDLSCTDLQIRKVASALEEIRRDKAIASFMDATSNWEKITNVGIKRRQFDHCYRALSFRLLRPNGDLYPCFVHIDDMEYMITNIVENGLEEAVIFSAFIGYYYFNCQGSFCNPALCPLYRENSICTEYFKSQDFYLSENAKRSPFF